MGRRLAALLLAASLAPLRAGAVEVQQVEQGAPGAEGEAGESVRTADAVSVVPGDEPVRISAIAEGGPGGPAGANGAAGDGGDAALGRVFGASGGGEVSIAGFAHGGAGGANAADLPAGDGAPVRLVNAVDGETAGALSLFQSARGGHAGGTGGRPGAAESILVRAKRAAALVLHSEATAGRGPLVFPGLNSSGFDGPGADAEATADASNSGGSSTVHGLAVGGPGGVRSIDEAGLAGGDALVFAAGSTRCRGCAVSVGSPSPPRHAPRPTRVSLATRLDVLAAGALAGGGGLGLAGIAGGSGGDATSRSVGRARRDAPVVVFDVARGGVGGFGGSLGPAASGGDAESIASGAAPGDSPVEVHADAEGGGAGAMFLYIDPDLGMPLPVPIGDGPPGGDALAMAEAEGEGHVVADARAAAGPGVYRTDPGASADARAHARGESGEARATAGSIGRVLDVEVRAIAELASHASSIARSATGERLPRRPRDADVFARSASAPPASALEEPRFPQGLRQALETGGAWIEAIGEVGGTGPPGHGRSGSDLVFEVELRAASGSPQVVLGFEAPRLPHRRFESIRVSVTKERQVLFDQSFSDRDEARRVLAGQLVDVGRLGVVYANNGLWPTVRSELARLRVELSGVRSSEEVFALRYAVGARREVLALPPRFPGGYFEPGVTPGPGILPWNPLLPFNDLSDVRYERFGGLTLSGVYRDSDVSATLRMELATSSWRTVRFLAAEIQGSSRPEGP